MTQTLEERRDGNREAQRRRRASGKAREAEARYRAKPENKAKLAEASKRWYADNRDHALAKAADRYRENRKELLERSVNNRYNVNRAEWLERQDNRCAICHVEFDNDASPHVDHDHACCPGEGSCGKCVRGLLCGPCNKGLGNFRDNPEVLTAAVAYLGATTRKEQ